jgi:hypothetical protein
MHAGRRVAYMFVGVLHACLHAPFLFVSRTMFVGSWKLPGEVPFVARGVKRALLPCLLPLSFPLQLDVLVF